MAPTDQPKTPSDRPVLVAGAGIMGASIAVGCAVAGMKVTTYSRRKGAAQTAVRRAAALAGRAGLAEDPESVATSVACVTRLEEVPRDVTLLVESLPESLAVKRSVLVKLLARLTADVTVLTNTSSLGVGQIGQAIGRPADTVGLHFMNPPILMPLVEIVTTSATKASARSSAEAFADALGKRLVRVDRDTPGFVWNRLQMVLIREAVQLVSDGLVSVEDVDAAVTLGLARRWQFAGPLATAALGGVETFKAVARNLLPLCSQRGDLDGLEQFLPPQDISARAGVRREEGLSVLMELERTRIKDGA